MAASASREFDVIVYGATGYVGNLVCEELTRFYQDKVSWAIAGRSQSAMQDVINKLQPINKRIAEVPMLVGDNHDAASLDAIASRAKAVISLSGPYNLIGEGMLAACLRSGTHYVDLTGEIQWIRKMILKYHEEAEAKGVKIVVACGFEAAVMDLGSYMVATQMKRTYGADLGSIEHVLLTSLPETFSGGSWYSFMNMFATISWSELFNMQSPYYLCPAGKTGTDGLDNWLPGFNRSLRMFTAPIVFKFPDRRVAHRSNALLKYGPDVHIGEVIGSFNPLIALLATFAMWAVNLFWVFPILHPLLRAVVPKPHGGPSRTSQLLGYWKSIVIGKAAAPADALGSQPAVLYGILGDARDPGYWGTARLVLEAGITLSEMYDGKAQGPPGGPRGGILTPAAALGDAVIGRLQNAGVTMVVREPESPAISALAATSGQVDAKKEL